MSARSVVNTAPPGSADATTIASTADPCPALVLRRAARRARGSTSSSAISQVFSNRLTGASAGLPVRHSTRTAEGTTGGHSPSERSFLIRAAEYRLGCERRLTAPESRTINSVGWPSGGRLPSSLRRRVPPWPDLTRVVRPPPRQARSGRHALRPEAFGGESRLSNNKCVVWCS